MEHSKYNPDEILQILNDFYHCQAVFDPEVYPGEDLTFQTTIKEWKETCDLVNYKSLAKCYHDTFQLPTCLEELEEILSTKTTSLLGFCRYIADYATKQNVSPIVMMGQPCISAAIFKTLISNLKDRGVDIQHISPSSKFPPLFYKHGAIILEEVSKLAPGSLTKFEFEDNRISKAGSVFLLFFLLAIIIVPVFWHFHWLLFVPLFAGITLLTIGSKFSPAKQIIGGYDTVRDLIKGMQAFM
ncbi:hypothetical protein [Mucilaginibacter glaciei]|uniref:Uncharacterized protein n=1 Tax=Mucilaginibacter glaciei TaxID=2772109 RepID=A0A926NZM7_9SPHI|nr:hypothetical protein [Mucilaginibacter glaciei]MBD1394609.1 hypothetical protein [Mucilaginibacter glaciei]